MNPASRTASLRIPAGIYCAGDYEALARDYMPAAHYEYVAGGCGRDLTVAANLAAFSDWAVFPRLLRDLSNGHTGLQLAGRQMAHPILLAPVAFQKLAHPAAELDTARAAQATDSTMVCSSLASTALEQVAAAAGAEKWFQLYFQAEPEATLALLRRAEAAGFTALVVTLDASIQVASRRALLAGFQMPADCVAVNLPPQQAAALPAAAQSRIFQGAMRTAPGWQELRWLLANTRLPVWVKGVLHPDDALALKQAGVTGLVVSNHGGRSLDGAPASLTVLPLIRAAVGDQYPLLLDGGIRSGSDIFKALALGADAVLVGRLQMYALSVAGALGVAHMLQLLREELEICMAQAGCATLAEIGSDCLLSKTCGIAR